MGKINLVLGTMTFGESVFGTDAAKFVEMFMSGGYDELDTAYVYNNGESEKLIGKVLEEVDRKKIKISTKVNPRVTGKLDAEAVNMQLKESLSRMGIDYVDVFYLHFPDPNTRIESVLEACDSLHKEGKFLEFGLSNFPAWMVTQIYYKCRENNYVLPTVYEGLYNPLSRNAERELDRCLTELGIRFNAYNPLCGGILTDKYKNFRDVPTVGRFINRTNYQKRYWKESFFTALKLIREVCKEYNMSVVEATYRFLLHHSMLKSSRRDSIIIGASTLKHLKQNMETISKGPLHEPLQGVFEQAWCVCKQDAPEYFRFYGTGDH